METLKDKVIIIAGGNGGIGRAASRLLALHGAAVVVASRSVPPDDSWLADVLKASPHSSAIGCDLSSAMGWRRLISFALDRYGRVDALVNCVGALTAGDLEGLTESETADGIRTNLLSVIYGCQALLPVLHARGNGTILTLGSVGGIVPMPFASLYCAAKHGVRGFSLSLSHEFEGTGINICLLSLGPVETRMLETEALDTRSVTAFINRPMEPDHAAEAILRLLEKPQRELILPRATGALCRVSGIFPGLFHLCYHVLRPIGAARLRSYRRRLRINNQPTSIEQRHVHSYSIH